MSKPHSVDRTFAGKIFGIGLSRTGTSSLHRAMQILGYRSSHNPSKFEQVLAADAAMDVSVAASYQFLDRTFPDCRFIYTERDLDDWLASCERYWAKHKRLVFDKLQQAPRMHQHLYGGLDYERDRFAAAFEAHDRTIRAYFENRPDDLLIIDLCGPDDPWPRLCQFLDQPVPQTPFPAVNQTAPVDQLWIRLLHFYEADWLVRTVGVEASHLARLQASKAFQSCDLEVPLALSESPESDRILLRLAQHHKSIVPLMSELKLSREEVEAVLRRAGEWPKKPSLEVDVSQFPVPASATAGSTQWPLDPRAL